QMDVAGLGNTGNRVIVDIENGKPTVQLKKVMDLMDLLGLQLVVDVPNSEKCKALAMESALTPSPACGRARAMESAPTPSPACGRGLG
ncbi:MAG: hypothetical protein WCH44_04135, partial [Betaproteobacteria bacterium]